MARLRYPLVLFDAGDTLVGPRESFGAVYARVLRTLGVSLQASALERGLRMPDDGGAALQSDDDHGGVDGD